ncbi:MAG: hypothetical protein ACERJ1_17985 [Halodesulfovibrio sp.]|uniref:hypothetical protein n=1 Tax=Halodesulfovibrio sp. TaxID=1912772 RepID=UPI00359EEA5D
MNSFSDFLKRIPEGDRKVTRLVKVKVKGRDKARDDKFFNCEQEHEDNYVAKQYGKNRQAVSDFLAKKCEDGTISYSTHKKVYALIKEELGLTN